MTLHVPLLAETRGLIGAAELARMQPGAVLIQASRGGIVEEQALAAALACRRGSAARQSMSIPAEPPAADNPLLALTGDAARRVLFTPHIAGVTRQAWATLFRAAWDNVERVLVHQNEPLYRVI